MRLHSIPDPLTLDGPVSSLPLDIVCIVTRDLCSEADAPAPPGKVVTEKWRQPHRRLHPPLCSPHAQALPAGALGHTEAAARGPWRPGCCHSTQTLQARVPPVPGLRGLTRPCILLSVFVSGYNYVTGTLTKGGVLPKACHQPGNHKRVHVTHRQDPLCDGCGVDLVPVPVTSLAPVHEVPEDGCTPAEPGHLPAERHGAAVTVQECDPVGVGRDSCKERRVTVSQRGSPGCPSTVAPEVALSAGPCLPLRADL